MGRKGDEFAFMALTVIYYFIWTIIFKLILFQLLYFGQMMSFTETYPRCY
jgi:hypothetical protein